MIKNTRFWTKQPIYTGMVAVIIWLTACSPAPVTITAPATTPVSTTSTITSSTTSSPTPGKSVTLDLVARNLSFDKSSITATAGADVVIHFNNEDSGIPHNFAVYQNLAGGQTMPVFIGKTVTGPGTIVYRFTAPAVAGSYFFECDVHPQSMNGAFIIANP
jgi:plastocyanin